MKRVPRKSSRVVCDYCLRDSIAQDGLFYFTCSFTCNFDICPSCYIIYLIDGKETVDQVREKMKEQKTEEVLIRLLGGGLGRGNTGVFGPRFMF